MRIVILLSTLILVSCDQSQFCDVAKDLRTTPELSALIYDTDEVFARDLAVHNTMYLDCPR